VTHDTDANKRKASIVTHDTDANKRKETIISHTTDANKRKASVVIHSTDANKKKASVITHNTDALKRSGNTITHTTDTLKRATTSVSHTTNARLWSNAAPTRYRNRLLYLQIANGIFKPIGNHRIASWNTNGRPANPRVGVFGLNSETGNFEYFNGSGWLTTTS
jgi:hypothetical protein